MNLERAITEPFRNYLNFHARLNAEIPILTGLTHHAATCLATSPEGTLSQMMAEADPSWKKKPPVKNSYSRNLATKLSPLIAAFGIISVHSAMDDLIVGIEAELDRFNCNCVNYDSDSTNENSEPLLKINKNNKLNAQIREDYILHLKYFRLIRNSLVHRDRRASKDLADYSKSAEFKKSKLNKFSQIELPEFNINQTIKIHPKLAVLNSILVREVARIIDRSIVSHLGKKGIVRMAIHHFFLKDDPLRTPAHHSPVAVLNTALTSHYLVGLSDVNSAQKIAKNENYWNDCLAGYRTHYK